MWRPQLRGRRPGRGGAPGWRAAGWLRDLRAQDLRPRLRGHDLLREGARPGRRPCRDHRAAGRRGGAGRRRLRLPPPARRRDRVRDQPRPCLRAVAAGDRARGGAGVRRAVHRPRRAGDPRAERHRLPGAGGGHRRLPGLRDPHRDRLRPDRAQPALAGAARAAGRDAPDLARRRRHELRDARAGQPDPRLRRRPAAGADRGPPGAPGRDPDHARRHPPHPLDRGPADHRRLRADRSCRGHGRREHRAQRRHFHRRDRGRALHAGRHLPHPEAAQAADRGREALGAWCRPDAAGRGRRPGGRAAGALRRRHRRRRRDRGRRGADDADRGDRRRPARPDHRDADRRRHHRRPPARGGLHGRRDGDSTATGSP